jgi:MoaE-MoaD fusion protein
MLKIRKSGNFAIGRPRSIRLVLVTVRLFAQLRERAGSGELSIELPEGARVRDALAELDGLAGDLPVVMAVNREYADGDSPLQAGDELALIPPVSGGEKSGTGTFFSRVTDDPLDPALLIDRVRDARAGAVVVFEGVTREVERLEYEAYAEMAEPRIAGILGEVVERHGLCAAAAEHRVGTVPLSEPSVIVAVSAPHRDAAFAGAREAIDRIKAEAPIWKKEVEGGEERWVEGTAPR